MKALLFVAACLLLLRAGPTQAQNLYETKWEQDGYVYFGLLVFYNDNDATMRINYSRSGGGKVKLAEYKCYGQRFDKDGYKGYLLDGRDANVVYNRDSVGYSADNFIFVQHGDKYDAPLLIDDQELQKPNLRPQAVSYWRQVATNNLTEAYVGAFFTKNEPLYKKLTAYTTQTSEASLGNTYSVTALGWGNGQWAVTTSRGASYTAQTWQTSSQFPEAWIKTQWDARYYISSLTYGGGQWAVAMSQGGSLSGQTWKTETYYPSAWVTEQWNAGYSVSAVAYGGGKWAVVMSKGTGYTLQTSRTDPTFPRDWIVEQWKNGYSMSTVAYGGGQWLVLMSKGTGYSEQTWRQDASYPQAWLGEQRAIGRAITSMAYGNGQWVVVVAKSTPYTQQASLAVSAYPGDWIKGQWAAGPGTTEPAPASARLHLVLVANTYIPNIGASCRIDRDNVVREFENFAQALEMPLVRTVLDERNFTRQNITAALAQVQPAANDVVVFVYTGHGFRWANQQSSWPMMSVRYNDYDDLASNALSLEEVYNTIVRKGARLNLILGDCCNSPVGISSRLGTASLASRQSPQGQVASLRQLFLRSRGTLLAAAARPNETSCGSSTSGGYFLSSFFAAISKEASQLNSASASWKSIMNYTISTAYYNTGNLGGCSPQTGIYYTTIQ